jgi:hypothetical protein
LLCKILRSAAKNNGITYKLRSEQYYPLIEPPEQKAIGKYVRMYLEYLKKHRRGHYTTLISEDMLNQRLYEIDIEAKTMVENIINQLTADLLAMIVAMIMTITFFKSL